MMLRLDTLDVLKQCEQVSTVTTHDLMQTLDMTRSGTVAAQRKLIKAGLLSRTPDTVNNVVGYTYHTTDTGVQLLRKYAALLEHYHAYDTTACC
jgi:DNA-binding MarR family transcriptional regulator